MDNRHRDDLAVQLHAGSTLGIDQYHSYHAHLEEWQPSVLTPSLCLHTF